MCYSWFSKHKMILVVKTFRLNLVLATAAVQGRLLLQKYAAKVHPCELYQN